MYTLADFVKYKLDTDEEFAELWVADHQSDSGGSEPFVEDIDEVEYDYDEADLWGDDFDVASPEEVEKAFGVRVKNKPFENDSDWVKPEWLVGKVPVLHSIGRIHHLLTWFDTEEEAEEFCEENEWEYKDDNDFVWNLEIYPEIEDKADAERFYYGVLGNPRPGSVTITKEEEEFGEAISPVEQAHQRRKKQFTSNAFKTLFQKFNKQGKFARIADWSIGRGGYDLDYEVYFKDIPVVRKMVDEEPTVVNHDILDAINMREEELLNYIKSADGFRRSYDEALSPEGYAPTKTGKAYKVFKVKNGKLYPPMVANKVKIHR